MSTNLWPSYEDLFDQAEEHALDMLLTQWKDLCNSEDLAFQKVSIIILSFSLHEIYFTLPFFYQLDTVQIYSSPELSDSVRILYYQGLIDSFGEEGMQLP